MTLSDYLDQHRGSRSAFALSIGVSRQALSRYALGQRRPEWEVLQKLAEVTGGAVMPNDFLSPPTVVDAQGPTAAGVFPSAPAAPSFSGEAA